jgi:hypothetical protein
MKTCYEFGNDLIKMCFEYKTRIKFDHSNKKIILCRIVFLSYKL